MATGSKTLPFIYLVAGWHSFKPSANENAVWKSSLTKHKEAHANTKKPALAYVNESKQYWLN